MRGGGVRTPRAPWKAAPSAAEDEPETGRTGGRKKGAWVRAWLTVNSAGQAEVVEVGKHYIMRRAGLPARDLRILDPLLSYPSTVLGRERAIVVGLEHIKAVITADEVLLMNYRDPSVEPFVDELQRRLRHRHNRLQGGAEDQKEEGTGENADWENVYDLEEPRSRSSSRDYDNYSEELNGNLEADDNRRGSVKSHLVNSDVPKFLPFEFVALEACLQAACSCLENEVLGDRKKTKDEEKRSKKTRIWEKASTTMHQIRGRSITTIHRNRGDDQALDEVSHGVPTSSSLLYKFDEEEDHGLRVYS